MTDRLRIVIVDDHPIVRSGMSLLLKNQGGFEVVGEATTHEEAISLIRSLHPDVVIIECLMSQINSVKLTCDIKREWLDLPVLAIAIHRNDDYFLDIIKAGANGYILKDAEPEDLFNAIRVVKEGEVWLSPGMALILVQQLRLYGNDESWGPASVTAREKEVLRLLADGHSVNEVARRLFISPSTVHTHRSNIMTKLGLHSRHDLIEQARKHGLINGQ